MKVLFAHRCHDGGLDEPRLAALPATVPWLAASARHAGHAPIVANFSRLGWRDVERYLGELKPDIVIATCATANRRAAVRLIRLAHRAAPRSIRGLVGVAADALPDAFLRRVAEADFVLLGDGIRAAGLACTAAAAGGRESLGTVPGVVARGGRVVAPVLAADLDALADPLDGLDAAGLVPERDLCSVILSLAEAGAPTRPRIRATSGIVRDVRRLREEHGLVGLRFEGPGLVADRPFLAGLAAALRGTKSAVSWELTASADAFESADRRDASALSEALAAAQRAGCRRVHLGVDAWQARHASGDTGEALATASSALRAHGLAPFLTVAHGLRDQGPDDVALLRGLIRAARPRGGRLVARVLDPTSQEWRGLAAIRGLADDYWFDEERDEVLVAPARQREHAEAALDLAMRDAMREGEPGPRDLEAVERRIGRGTWTLIDWGDYWAVRGDLDEAESRYREAAELERWNPFPWLRLAATCRRGPRPRTDVEAESLRAALHRVPRHAAARARLAELRQGRSKGASWRRRPGR